MTRPALPPLGPLLDELRLCAAYVDASRRVVYLNLACERWLGALRDDLLGQRLERVSAIPAWAQVFGRLGEALAGERLEVDVHARLAGSERLCPVHVELVPHRDEQGVIQGAFALATERYDVEGRLRLLAEHIGEVVWLCRADLSAYEYVSPAFERVLGCSAEGLTPQTFFAWIAAEDRERVMALPALGPGDEEELDFRITRPHDGAIRWIRSRRFPIADEQGVVRHFAGVTRDITAEKEAARMREALLERLLLAHEDERRRIARELHDEAGQGVGSLIVGLAELQSMPASEEGFADRVAALRGTAEAVLEELTRIARGLHPRLIEQHGLADALASHVAEVGRTHHLEVDLQVVGLDAEPLPHAVATTVFRIVQEALTNVVGHAEAQTVSVVVHREADRLQLCVEDDGRGFDVSQPTRGLGLLGIHERVKLLGGRVAVESRPGDGTTVLVRIPVGGREGGA